jgi:hypothetical protein
MGKAKEDTIMGWSYILAYSERSDRKRLIAELIEGCDNETHKRTCLRHCAKGNVLWTVWEILEKSTGTIQRYIGCDLLNYGGKKYGWGYKSLEESMGPNHLTCPVSYFELVPEPDTEWGKEWRKDVLKNRAELKSRMDTLRKNFHKAKAEGKHCIMDLRRSTIKSLNITSLRPLQGVYNGRTYRIPRRFIGESRVVY